MSLGPFVILDVTEPADADRWPRRIYALLALVFVALGANELMADVISWWRVAFAVQFGALAVAMALEYRR
jgi:hypothetical protein